MFLSSQREFENEDNSQVNLFEPDGLLYFPVIFTCLGVTAFFVMAGGAWDLYQKFNCFRAKRGMFHNKKLINNLR